MIKFYSIGPALVLASLFLFDTSVVHAKQADCLIADKDKTYVDGPCEFKTTDKDGSFTLTLDTIELKLMADPGAKAGRAYYEDSASSEASWVTDVERDDACWKHNDVQICAWAGSRPGATTAAASDVENIKRYCVYSTITNEDYRYTGPCTEYFDYSKDKHGIKFAKIDLKLEDAKPARFDGSWMMMKINGEQAVGFEHHRSWHSYTTIGYSHVLEVCEAPDQFEGCK